MSRSGTITQWYDDKGYGFIDADPQRIFFHISALSDLSIRPKVGMQVIFQAEVDKKGRLNANYVALHTHEVNSHGISSQKTTKQKVANQGKKGKIKSKKYHKKQQGGRSLWVIWLTGVYFIFVLTSMLLSYAPIEIVVGYLALSAITFLLFAYDKRAAQLGNRRTPERDLLLFSLLGGWSGALIAQQYLRHKSQKQPFKSLLFCTVVVNIAAFLWTLTAQGQHYLQRLF